MGRLSLSQTDKDQIEAQGLTEADVEKQVEIFEKGAPYADLVRPCTIGDGIRQLNNDTVDRMVRTFEQQGRRREMVKFVPASGAATRMFKALLKIYHEHPEIDRDTLFKWTADRGGNTGTCWNSLTGSTALPSMMRYNSG